MVFHFLQNSFSYFNHSNQHLQGIDWEGDDDNINENFYKCQKEKNVNLNSQKAKSNTHCETPPMVSL